MEDRTGTENVASWWWIPAAVWMAGIFVGSSVPGSQVPGRFGFLGHLVEYAVLGSLLFLALRGIPGGARALAAAVLVASVYGVTDELHQAFVPGRTPDILDWSVDTLGALAGASMLWLIARRAATGGPS